VEEAKTKMRELGWVKRIPEMWEKMITNEKSAD